jgi:hypothetical protein
MSLIEADRIPVASDLLRTYSLNQKGPKKATPLMMEFRVNPETGPFLVSSARSVFWVTHHDSKVRAAFRPIHPPTFFAEVVEAVAQTGAEARWDNVHPLTEDGLRQAIAHVLSYDLPSPEILAHPDAPFEFRTTESAEGEKRETHLGCVVQRADWLPPGTVVVLPQDREFVGFVLMSEGTGLAVVHNASRGMAVCRMPA